MLKLITAIIGLALCHLSYPKLELPKHSAALLKSQDALYLPSGKALEFVSFGYRNVLSHILWFKAVQYFGRQIRSDRDFTYLSHMCDLVTTLNPQARYVYEFAGVILAWELKQPEAGIKFLEKGIASFPDYWRFYYTLGVLKFHFLKDDEAAQADFARGAKLPGAHPVMARMAMRKMTKAGRADIAVQFLREMLEETTDEASRESLMDSLKIAVHERNIAQLEEAISRAQDAHEAAISRLDELVALGVISKLPEDPFGGEYEVKVQDGQTQVISQAYEQFREDLKRKTNPARDRAREDS